MDRKYKIWPKGMKTNVLTKTMRHQEQQQAGLSLTGRGFTEQQCALGGFSQGGFRQGGFRQGGFIAKTQKICRQGSSESHTQRVPSEQSQLQDKHENNPAGLPSSL